MIITLPWPPKDASPNGQHGSWGKKSRARRRYHKDCAWTLKEFRKPDLSALAEDAKLALRICFYPPCNRHRDLDNALASIKGGLDAFAKWLGVNDHRFQPIKLEWGGKIKGGQVVIEIEEVE